MPGSDTVNMLFLDLDSIKTVDPDGLKGAAEVEFVCRTTSNETNFKVRQTVYEKPSLVKVKGGPSP